MVRKQYRGIEKRKIFRLETPLDVKISIITEDEVFESPKSMKVKSRDISLQGLCIETPHIEIDGVHMLSGHPGAQKNRLEMEIELYPHERPVEALGEVCWYDLSRETEDFMFQVGIVFISIEPAGEKLLKEFLKKHKKSNKWFFKKFFR